MRGDMTVDMWLEFPEGKAAMKKFNSTDPNFRMYRVDRLMGFKGLRVHGMVFRRAKSGVNKGKLCTGVKGTKETVYVSRAEIEEME
jgi:hypothetical protein